MTERKYAQCPSAEIDCEGNCYGFECLYCGVNTMHIDEYYMLNDDLWEDVTALAGTNGKGMVCIGCVEGQLGRNVTAADFKDVPLNYITPWQSDRLRDRLATSH